ncbi:MAG: helix-turn-helix domain-containing protein [Alphaproteobacteria bacterium]|nr:helix-turn-helix domain-containing protein [Alphaproteobacteria bacterium]
MHPYVLIRPPEGPPCELVPGDVIGRQPTAALPLDDGRVSEAHAMLSLREGALRLLALRGAFAVEGRPVDQVALTPGLRVTLAQGVELEVLEVSLPEQVLGIEGPGLPLRALPGVASVFARPRLRLARGWDARAEAWVWSAGDVWRLRVGGGEARPVGPGDTLELGALTLSFRGLPLAGAGPSLTRRGEGVAAPLHLVATYDSVHLHRGERVALHLGGILARLISELVAVGGPLSWQALVAELWPGEDEPMVLRSRLDTNLSRLRRKLRAAGVRVDLVRTDGTGQLELLLYPGDSVEDRT